MARPPAVPPALEEPAAASRTTPLRVAGAAGHARRLEPDAAAVPTAPAPGVAVARPDTDPRDQAPLPGLTLPASQLRAPHRTSLVEQGASAALPPGAVTACSQRGWLSAVAAHPDTVALRADALSNLASVAATLARYADWGELTTRPTWARIGQLAGLARRSVARWIAWLRARNLLGLVETGSTPATRPMALADLDGNRAAVYLLCHPPGRRPSAARLSAEFADDGSPDDLAPDVHEASSAPPVDRNGTPPGPAPQEMGQIGRARAVSEYPPLRGVAKKRQEEGLPAETSAPHSVDAPYSRENALRRPWGLHSPAHTRRDMLELCRRLQDEAPLWRAIGSTRRLRSLLRPWLAAGWTAAGIGHAVDHKPDGTSWNYAWRTTEDLTNPPGWIRHRRKYWTDPSGKPLPDPRADVGRSPAGQIETKPPVTATEDRPAHIVAAFTALRRQFAAHLWGARQPG